MKISKYAMVCLLMACLLVFTACQSSESNVTEPTVTDPTVTEPSKIEPDIRDTFDVFEASFEGSYGNHKQEYFWKDIGTYEDPNAQREMTVMIDGTYVTGTYDYSIVNIPEFFTRKSYRFDGGSFAVNESGLLVAYVSDRATEETFPEPFTKEQCISIARDFLKEYVDIEQYRVTAKSDRVNGGYEITFTKYLNDYPTTDYAQVCVLDNGKIRSYSSCNFGLLPSTSNIMFDENIALLRVTRKLDTIYSKESQTYGTLTYRIDELRYTVLENGELGLFCQVTLLMEDAKGDGSISTTSGEIVSFIIEM